MAHSPRVLLTVLLMLGCGNERGGAERPLGGANDLGDGDDGPFGGEGEPNLPDDSEAGGEGEERGGPLGHSVPGRGGPA